jgi:hypothetical protein
MRSLQSRLLALWIMLVLSRAATAYLLFESFQQTANARVARSEELVARACREIADRYQLFVSGWAGLWMVGKGIGTRIRKLPVKME